MIGAAPTIRLIGAWTEAEVPAGPGSPAPAGTPAAAGEPPGTGEPPPDAVAFGADKAIVDESTARTAVAAVTADRTAPV